MTKQYIQILDLISDDVNGKFIATIYGKSLDNKNVVLNVEGYKPFFYVRVPDRWTKHTAHGFISNLKLPSKKFFYPRKKSVIKTEVMGNAFIIFPAAFFGNLFCFAQGPTIVRFCGLR